MSAIIPYHHHHHQHSQSQCTTASRVTCSPATLQPESPGSFPRGGSSGSASRAVAGSSATANKSPGPTL
ncbi:unnamed protein product [Gadus morhua 'NCC']